MKPNKKQRKDENFQNVDFAVKANVAFKPTITTVLTGVRTSIYDTTFLDDIDATATAESILSGCTPDTDVKTFMDAWIDIKKKGAKANFDLQEQNHKRARVELATVIDSEIIQVDREIAKLMSIQKQFKDKPVLRFNDNEEMEGLRDE